MVGIFLSYLVECGIHIAVSASHAELWRTRRKVLCCGQYFGNFHSNGSCHTVWRELSGAWQVAGESSCHLVSRSEHTLYHFFHNGLSVFNDEQFRTFSGKMLYALFWYRILRHLFYII